MGDTSDRHGATGPLMVCSFPWMNRKVAWTQVHKLGHTLGHLPEQLSWQTQPQKCPESTYDLARPPPPLAERLPKGRAPKNVSTWCQILFWYHFWHQRQKWGPMSQSRMGETKAHWGPHLEISDRVPLVLRVLWFKTRGPPDIKGSTNRETAVSGIAINLCPPSVCHFPPQTSFFRFSTHLLCFVYKMVRLVPVGKKVCCFLVVDSDVMICK